MESERSGYTCHVCGRTHEGVPPSFAADFPDMYANLSAADKGTRAVIGSDQCIIDGKWFFLRGCLEIPIIGSPERFLWGLWATIYADVFGQIDACWNEEGREKRYGPFKGRLANSLSEYAETLNLKLSIVIQPVGTRPLFVIDEPEHPLAIAQRLGFSRREADSLSATLLHKLSE
jgi:hypothetical protein